MQRYNPKAIESKWQKKWEAQKISRAQDNSKKKKYYALVEFPYPSGDGLHVGHTRPYVALDIIARKRRMEGYNVLYPFGWDAFGLPTENYAIKTGIHPAKVTKQNTDNFRRQVQALGISFDWSREINTTDPAYYQWTQWIFLQLYKHGLAYKAKTGINWCLNCKIGLANEEVVDGKCERCGGPTEKREKEQWMLAITKYADRLLKDLDTVDYLEKIKMEQRNWIGKSEGAEIEFRLHGIAGQDDGKHSVKIFTTRPDTIFGATFLAVSPELAKKWFDIGWKASGEVQKYVAKELQERKAKNARDFQEKEKTGVNAGISAINPANGEKIPAWVVNYVLGSVGTGAIMAVPAHDERDFEFAKKYGLPVCQVVISEDYKKGEAYTGVGTLIHSGEFTGIDSEEAKKKITEFVGGKWTATYKLRDWVFSRQRYWGEPIPMVFCQKDGWIPLPEKELPLKLPKVKNYQPTDTGESPLAAIKAWVKTKCPKCKSPARRETDVMPNWAGSSWYYLAYIMRGISPGQLAGPISKYKGAFKKWLPVDWYNGGMEHTTLHLLYSRFWNKFLYDIGIVPVSEPYKKRTSHGLILAEGGVKMSKSKGNVVNPDTIVARYGADTLRIYEMFMGPFDQPVAWSTESIAGSRRFLEKVWKLQSRISTNVPPISTNHVLQILLHKTIKKVTEDIEAMQFNTAISSLMILVNAIEKEDQLTTNHYSLLTLLLSPFAPHMAEELWSRLGHKKSLFLEATWPKVDPRYLLDNKVEIVVQVNGKLRRRLLVSAGLVQQEVERQARADERIQAHTRGKKIRKVIFVPDRLINFVT